MGQMTQIVKVNFFSFPKIINRRNISKNLLSLKLFKIYFSGVVEVGITGNQGQSTKMGKTARKESQIEILNTNFRQHFKLSFYL